MRYTSSGKAVTNLSVATSNKYTNAAGALVEETIWWKVAVWGKQADACNQYLSKGRQVYVEGRMAGDKVVKEDGSSQIFPRVWTGQDGVAKASFEITASFVKFLGGRNGAPAPAADAPADDGPSAYDDDDIPF